MKINGRGLTGTILVHALILALLILGGLTFPDPPPEEMGILVNFGIDQTGLGNAEPKGDEENQGNPDMEVVQSPPEVSVPEPVSTPAVKETKTADNTQDVEVVKVKEDPKPSAEEIRKQQEEIARKKAEAEAERIRKAEEERIRQEQIAEQKRLEEEQRLRDQQANRLNNLGRNTFGNKGTGETSGSEGVTSGTGNQGSVSGTEGATNYGDGGGLGSGITYGLGTRKVPGVLPKPNVDNCIVTSRIEVEVEIQVDQQGNVVSASIKRATFDENCIRTVVLQAAKKTKFETDNSASFKETGWIKYIIEPN